MNLKTASALKSVVKLWSKTVKPKVAAPDPITLFILPHQRRQTRCELVVHGFFCFVQYLIPEFRHRQSTQSTPLSQSQPKQVYSIVLAPAPEEGYLVTVPDQQINTEGETLGDAITMARDAIGLWGICEQDAGRTSPEPSDLTPEHEPGRLVALAEVDFDVYRRANEMRTVRKNVTLPAYRRHPNRQASDGLKALCHYIDKGLIFSCDKILVQPRPHGAKLFQNNAV